MAALVETLASAACGRQRRGSQRRESRFDLLSGEAIVSRTAAGRAAQQSGGERAGFPLVTNQYGSPAADGRTVRHSVKGALHAFLSDAH